MLVQSLRIAAGAAAAAGALAVTLPAAGIAQPSNGQSCFRLSHMDNSTMAEDNRVMFIRVYGNQYFRMDFSGSCNRSGNEPLVVRSVDSGDLICHAIDLNISVRGTREGCIPTSLRRLTSDEVAAIPPKDRP
jgi:hypothetical protein